MGRRGHHREDLDEATLITLPVDADGAAAPVGPEGGAPVVLPSLPPVPQAPPAADENEAELPEDTF